MGRAWNFQNLTGRTFGRLVVTREAPPTDGHTRWECQCSCGVVTQVDAINLKSGRQVSCGCWKDENTKARSTLHGLSNSGEFRVWSKMRGRCHTTTNRRYADYGGRGILVCEEWRDDFSAFYRDMGPRPSERHTIDRIDNDGPYSLQNCQWTTRKAQNRNKRNTRFFEWNGTRVSLGELAEQHAMHTGMLRRRLKRGLTIEQALYSPRYPNRYPRGRPRKNVAVTP